jgi:hypothetical protein
MFAVRPGPSLAQGVFAFVREKQMAKPPADIPPSELWLKLSEPRPSEVLDFPRKGANGKPIGQIRIRVLRAEDHNVARLRAQTDLREAAKRVGMKDLSREDMDSPAIREVIGDLTAHELLQMACLGVEPMPGGSDDEDSAPRYPLVFHSAEAVRKSLTADETAVLFNAYLLVQDKYGPFERNFDEGDMDAWVTRLEEGASEFPLAHMPWPQLVRLAFCFAGRLSSLSRILESQFSSLPDTLQSSLKNYCLGISSSGEPQEDETESSLESSVEVSIDVAARVARDAKDNRSF